MMKINLKKISILLLTFSIIGLISLGAVSAQNILTDNVTNIDPMSTGGNPYYVHHNTDSIYKGDNKAIIGNPYKYVNNTKTGDIGHCVARIGGPYKYVNNTKTVNNETPYNIDPRSTSILKSITKIAIIGTPYNIDSMSIEGNPYKYGNKINSNTTGNEILENNISEVPVKK